MYRSATSTADLIGRAGDLLDREYLSTADAHLLRRTLRLLAARTGIAVADLIEGLRGEVAA